VPIVVGMIVLDNTLGVARVEDFRSAPEDTVVMTSSGRANWPSPPPPGMEVGPAVLVLALHCSPFVQVVYRHLHVHSFAFRGAGGLQ